MAAPRGDFYSPKSGPLAGMIFRGTPGTSQAYNRYQQARAHALGFSSYSQERRTRQSSIFKNLLAGEKTKPSVARRTDLLKAIAENLRIETVEEKGKGLKFRNALDVDFTDHSKGGSYDLYLQRIGRRTGLEDWNPGETP